jgi:hypothetical protein
VAASRNRSCRRFYVSHAKSFRRSAYSLTAMPFASPEHRRSSNCSTRTKNGGTDGKQDHDFCRRRCGRRRVGGGRGGSGYSTIDQPGLPGASWLLGASTGNVLAPLRRLQRQRTQRLLGCLHEHLGEPAGKQCTSAGATSATRAHAARLTVWRPTGEPQKPPLVALPPHYARPSH